MWSSSQRVLFSEGQEGWRGKLLELHVLFTFFFDRLLTQLISLVETSLVEVLWQWRWLDPTRSTYAHVTNFDCKHLHRDFFALGVELELFYNSYLDFAQMTLHGFRLPLRPQMMLLRFWWCQLKLISTFHRRIWLRFWLLADWTCLCCT